MIRGRLWVLPVSAFALAACEALPVDLPGVGAGDRAPAESRAPAVPASQGSQARPVDSPGLAGAALCISSAYYLADLGAVPEEQGVAFAERWTSILEVVPASSADARQEAVDDSYQLLTQLDSDGSNAGFDLARLQFENDTCTSTEFQRNYLRRWGDPDLMSERVGGGQ